MAVAATAGMLRTLHRMHRQLADLAEQLLAGPRAVTARTRQVQAAEGKKAAAAEDVKRARMAADQKQLQLKSSETKLRDLTAKLNACKTNREYQTLGDQIAADTMATKVLEDEILFELVGLPPQLGRLLVVGGHGHVGGRQLLPQAGHLLLLAGGQPARRLSSLLSFTCKNIIRIRPPETQCISKPDPDWVRIESGFIWRQ